MPKLTLIGLPLGNIEDITLRGMKALFSSDIILAEDTRNYLKIKGILKERFPEILKQLEVNVEARPELISYREQNHKQITPKILSLIAEGKSVSLISDAGMPTISDPGFRLVEEVINRGFEVDVIPGPTAVESALAISGLPTDRFVFLGFLPRQVSKIKQLITDNSKLTTIIYESPYRIIKTLETIAEINPDFKVAACNDLTKKFQKIERGNITDIVNKLKSYKIQGEWVIVLNSSDNN